MDTSAIDETIYSIKSAMDLANTLKDLKVSQAQSERINDMTMMQLEALNNAMTSKYAQEEMVETINKIQAELEGLKTWESMKIRYGLVSVDGAMVYALKEDYRKYMPPHWICANCYRLSIRSILQPVWDAGGLWILRCPACKTDIHTGQFKQRIPVYI